MSLSRIFRDDFFNPTFEGFLDFPQSAALTAGNNQDQLLQAQQMMKLDVSETPTEYKGMPCIISPHLSFHVSGLQVTYLSFFALFVSVVFSSSGFARIR